MPPVDGIRDDGKGPLFRTARGKAGALNGERMRRVDACRIIRRRVVEVDLKVALGCHIGP